jgi:CBS domain-containing protein
MLVKDVMTRGAFTCRPHDSLAHVAKIMWEHDCGAVPVVDVDGKVRAMITDRDICMAAYWQGRPLAEIRVESAASRNVISIQENEMIDLAEARMATNQVRRLPVVDERGYPVGVLSLGDLTRKGRRGEDLVGAHAGGIARTLAAISTPGDAHA